MSLQPYDDLAKSHALDASSSVPIEHPILENLGMFVQASRNGMLRGIWFASIFAWTFFLFFFVIMPSDGDSVMLIVMPLFCLGPFLIGFLLVAIYAFVMSTLLDQPQLMISGILLKRNDSIDFDYKQTFKRDVTLRSLSFTLILRESATYDQGTTTVTDTHDNVIDESAEFDVDISPDTGITRTLSFGIPADGMHSFEAHRNKLEWFLKVSMDIPNFPDFEKVYKLKVLPEVADES